MRFARITVDGYTERVYIMDRASKSLPKGQVAIQSLITGETAIVDRKALYDIEIQEDCHCQMTNFGN